MGIPLLDRGHAISFPEPHGYILDENFNPIAVPVKYAIRCRHMTERAYRVAATEWEDGTRVSTVLLSVDHWFVIGRDDPTFETMIFPTDDWDFRHRRLTTADALEAHQLAVRIVMSRNGPPIRDDRVVLSSE